MENFILAFSFPVFVFFFPSTLSEASPEAISAWFSRYG